MTDKQAEKLKLKIKRIKSELAADKRRWGGYFHDGRGLRYLPPKYYIKLEDYKGGVRYLNWFRKNFPDDIGFPDFLFEWTIILFKSGKIKEAESKAFKTYCSNTYIFDKFFGKQTIQINKYEGSNIETLDSLNDFVYSSKQSNLHDFSVWLEALISSKAFLIKSHNYVNLLTQLKHENNIEIRKSLIDQMGKIGEEF